MKPPYLCKSLIRSTWKKQKTQNNDDLKLKHKFLSHIKKLEIVGSRLKYYSLC